MRTRLLFVSCAFVVLIALTWRSPIAPVSKVFAQQYGPQPAAEAQQAGRGGRGNTPTFSGPPAGMPKLTIDLFSSKNF